MFARSIGVLLPPRKEKSLRLWGWPSSSIVCACVHTRGENTCCSRTHSHAHTNTANTANRQLNAYGGADTHTHTQSHAQVLREYRIKMSALRCVKMQRAVICTRAPYSSECLCQSECTLFVSREILPVRRTYCRTCSKCSHADLPTAGRNLKSAPHTFPRINCGDCMDLTCGRTQTINLVCAQTLGVWSVWSNNVYSWVFTAHTHTHTFD